MKSQKNIKRLFCFLLVMTMLFSSVMIVNAESAEEMPENTEANLSERELRMEEILESYHEKIQEQESQAATASIQENKFALQEETVELLNKEGFEAYGVNSETYKNIQNVLDTDLEELGMSPEYSYIVVLDGENENGNGDAQIQASAGSSFNYTYNGTTYKLRRLTVTSEDDTRMHQSGAVDLLKKSNVESVIRNCLNTAITAYLDAISGVFGLGTVASLCGFDVANLQRPSDASLKLEAFTLWTRKYTQVWSGYDQKWLNGSCVEYATLTSYTHGGYYEAATNQTVTLYRKDAVRYSYSRNYSNTTWQNQYAVVGYLNSFIQYDTVGDVKYKYGGTVKITHYEYF